VSDDPERLTPLTDAERSVRKRRRQRAGAIHISLDLVPAVLGEMIDRGIISERDALDRRKVSVALEAKLPELFRSWQTCSARMLKGTSAIGAVADGRPAIGQVAD
jgi:hypothetical protein